MVREGKEMKPTLEAGAQSWVNYCEAQKREIMKLEKMLTRVLEEIDYQVGRGAVILDDDVMEWREKYK